MEETDLNKIHEQDIIQINAVIEKVKNPTLRDLLLYYIGGKKTTKLIKLQKYQVSSNKSVSDFIFRHGYFVGRIEKMIEQHKPELNTGKKIEKFIKDLL